MSDHVNEPEPHRPAFDTGNVEWSKVNPWLAGLAALSLITFVVGVVMYNANQPGFLDSGDAGLQMIGIWLVGTSLIAAALLLAAGAVCWQVRKGQQS
jgi:hypothetical protein